MMLISANAQQRDKLEALRVSFITKRLELANAEAEKFWPLYNEYNDKLRALKKNLRQHYHQYADQSDDQAEQLYQLDLQSRQAEADLHKTYGEKIKAVIGVRKTVRLKIAEEDFRKEMINTIRERNDQ